MDHACTVPSDYQLGPIFQGILLQIIVVISSSIIVTIIVYPFLVIISGGSMHRGLEPVAEMTTVGLVQAHYSRPLWQRTPECVGIRRGPTAWLDVHAPFGRV